MFWRFLQLLALYKHQKHITTTLVQKKIENRRPWKAITSRSSSMNHRQQDEDSYTKKVWKISWNLLWRLPVVRTLYHFLTPTNCPSVQTFKIWSHLIPWLLFQRLHSLQWCSFQNWVLSAKSSPGTSLHSKYRTSPSGKLIKLKDIFYREMFLNFKNSLTGASGQGACLVYGQPTFDSPNTYGLLSTARSDYWVQSQE